MICIENNFFDDINHFFGLVGDFTLFEKTDEANWQGARSEGLDEINREAYELCVATIVKRFPLLEGKSFRVDARIHLRSDDYVNPHMDESDYNCLVYLKGFSSQFNGTGFYTHSGDGNIFLNATVGFQPNRAVFFDRQNIHSCLNALSESDEISKDRYTLNMFIYLGDDNE